MRFFRNLSIRTQLLILPFYSVAVFSIILILLNTQIESILLEENNHYTDYSFDQVKQNISSNCDIYNRILLSLAYNTEVQNYILETDMGKKYQDFVKVDNLVNNTLAIKSGIIDVVLVSDHSKSYCLKGKIDQFTQIFAEMPRNPVNYYTGIYHLSNDQYKGYYFVAVTTIYSINPNSYYNKKIGQAALIINTNQLGLSFSNPSETSIAKFYLVDRNNQVYSSNDLKSINSKLDSRITPTQTNGSLSKVTIDNKSYWVKYNELPSIDGKIISLIPEKALFSNLVAARSLTYRFLIVAIILILIPFVFIISNILSPLNKFVGFIDSLKSGQLKQLQTEIHLEGYSEIKLMSVEFNSMLKEIDGLTHRLLSSNSKLYEAELEKKKAELSYLTSQINPHFLYNTLESIRGVAICEQAEKATVMLGALGQMFRYCVAGEDMVKLDEEVQIIKSYVQIQLIRFSNRFTVHYDFDNDALGVKIPRMLLQPIVENAFNHGLEKMEENGSLIIGGRIEDKILCIWVRDNGAGIEKNKLDGITAKLINDKVIPDTEPDSRASIGVANVNNRIKIIYGTSYGILITSEQGHGTEVVLRFPTGREQNV